MFSCSRSSKVKEARGRHEKTLTEQHKAELRARRKEEAAQRSQRQVISSTESLTSESEEAAKGLYVYKRVDESRRVSVTVHSTRPPQRAKSLEACRPPPLALAAA